MQREVQTKRFSFRVQGGAEGGYPHKIPLDSGDVQYSRHVVNTNATYYQTKHLKKCLETAEK